MMLASVFGVELSLIYLPDSVVCVSVFGGVDFGVLE